MWTMRRLAPTSLVIVGACVASLPRPTYVQQPTSALLPVGYPPPPARVEFVPKQPASDAVWIDGEWAWQGRRWAWRIGRWLVAPKNARYAPWTMVREADGTIDYAAGAWRDDKSNEVTEPAPLATAKPSLSDVVDTEGDLEQTGKSIRPQNTTGSTGSTGTDGGDGGPGTEGGDTEGGAGTDAAPD
jgi:hypothetical protein